MRARVRKDLREAQELPALMDSWLPSHLMDNIFDVMQPDWLEDEEFSLIIATYDEGKQKPFVALANAMDFEFATKLEGQTA